MVWQVVRVPAVVVAALVGGLSAPDPARAAEDDVLVEFHYQPVANAQISVWLEDADGNFVQDVFVTQATGSLGIGNRSGRWDFLSSWRFPYGPRPQVLPVWAHARGKTYPALIFHDDDASDLNSLGWHENTSSPEPYFCRPLAEDEHNTISTDTMTCPSPATFQSDKGRFDPSGATSVYPPRNDLVEFEEGHDHADVYELSTINDLDSVTGATPMGMTATLVTTVVDGTAATQGPLVAWVEVNLEHDENADWDFDREADHYVDPRLANFGIEYLGQPSVVYRLEFDPAAKAFVGTDAYAGYGDWDGLSGSVHPPDDSISTTAGSGGDRLQLYTLNGETFRFGVYSHGLGSGSGAGPDPDPEDPDNPGWGACRITDLPSMVSVEPEALDFDTVRVHFTLPQIDDAIDVRNIRIYYRAGEMPLTQTNASSAIQEVPPPENCGGDLVSGGTGWCDLHELFGNHTYQIGVRYEDACANASAISSDSIATPAQEFAQVDGLCFVATAAYGAPWENRVSALRTVRDRFMKPNLVGAAFVAMYYAYGPSFAGVIGHNRYARAVARAGLYPLADIALQLTGYRDRG
jgi:hypothetical protein